MAHILFITPYYPPENGAAAACISETAMRLVQLGHQVTVLTTVPNYPIGTVPVEYRGRLLQEEMRDGVRVVRVWSYVSANTSFCRRILPQLAFALFAPLLGWKAVGRPDIIIVQSPPLFDAIAGRMLAWLKGCPFIFMVADLWPAAAVELGMLHNRLLIRLSEWLEWSTYQRASLIWVVTEGIRDILLERGLSPERVFLLTNGVNTAKFRPFSRTQARAELGWDGQFTLLYGGTLGVTHGIKTILDTAEQLRSYHDIRFVLVGEGSEKANLIAQAQRRNLTNVTFIDSQPHDRMPLLLAASDACVVHVRKASIAKGILPIKMFEAMACARPILLALDGEARRIAVQEAEAAIYVEPENPAALASAILHLRAHPDLAETLGPRGRTYVKAQFDYDRLVTRLDARIMALLEKKMAEEVMEWSHSPECSCREAPLNHPPKSGDLLAKEK